MSNENKLSTAPAGAVAQKTAGGGALSVFADGASFNTALRMAQCLASSTVVPKEYHGNVGNCMIAIEMASRINTSPMMVMQNLYIVNGRPAWSSQWIIAMINSSRRYKTELQFEFGRDKADGGLSCRAWAEDYSGHKVYGPKITMNMANDEGWTSKNGSKWKTMPDVMIQYEAFYMEHPKEDEEVVKAYLEERVIPKLKEMGLTGHVFVKNGRFSNKFNANGTCNLYGLHELYRAIILINYEAMCCGAEGADEIVVRKFIESSAGMTPCIYNGLPLRPEFRVFYDFDARKPIFTANYWDYDYVYPHLYHATDKIIFEHERERLEGVYAHFKDAVQDKVADAMQNVQGLTGQWSVDVLMDEREKFWLIDMAIAQRSAYWEMRPEGYAE